MARQTIAIQRTEHNPQTYKQRKTCGHETILLSSAARRDSNNPCDASIRLARRASISLSAAMVALITASVLALRSLCFECLLWWLGPPFTFVRMTRAFLAFAIAPAFFPASFHLLRTFFFWTLNLEGKVALIKPVSTERSRTIRGGAANLTRGRAIRALSSPRCLYSLLAPRAPAS